MANIFRYLRELFKEAEESSPSNPVDHHLIERTVEEQIDYDHWIKSLVKRRLVDWLNDQYSLYQVLPQDIDAAIDFLNTPSSKGFIVHFHQTNYSKREIVHFFDYLKERVHHLNYRSQISDSRTFSRNHWVETIQRHYLKPRNQFVEGQKLEQGFGNITIELELRDDKVHNLRMRATHYQDHLYQEPRDFSSLMQELLL